MNSINNGQEARNFYLIGHRCNSPSKIDKAFTQKVNGIECDLWADRNKKWWISHEGLFKTELKEWLSYVAKAEQQFGPQLSLIVFDIKSALPVGEVRNIINDVLPPDLPRIYSTAKIQKAYIFQEIVPLLDKHEGIAVDEEDDPDKVAAFFQLIGATQCWYGNGITLIPFDDQFHDSMQKAAGIREFAPFSKIYTWSIHRENSLRKYLLHDKVDGMIVGLDGMLTQPVSNALKIINESAEIQLADRKCHLF